MRRQPALRLSVLCILGLAVSSVRAENLFDEVSKDFGSVPRGTLLAHNYRLKNTTTAPLHVAGLRTSCGCALATVGQAELAPGAETFIHLSIDTNKYAGPRIFTVYVTFDRPFVDEARLLATATSREDLTLNPGQLHFGRVKKGSSPTAAVTIEHRGLGKWQITEVEKDNGYLLPELKEMSRGVGLVVYQLSVKLRDDTPVGLWHADVWLKTTDPATPKIRVPLMMEIEGHLTATPSEVVLGRLKPGSKGERKVVLRGTTPFKVLKVEGADDQLQVRPDNDDAKAVHVLNVTFIAGPEPAELTKQLKVITDLPADPAVDVTVRTQIVR